MNNRVAGTRHGLRSADQSLSKEDRVQTTTFVVPTPPVTVLEQIEYAAIAILVLVALMIAIALYNIANHQGGLGTALFALLTVLVPTIPVIILSYSLMPMTKPIPALTIVSVCFGLSILLTAPAWYVMARYQQQHARWALAITIAAMLGIVVQMVLLTVAAFLPIPSLHPQLSK